MNPGARQDPPAISIVVPTYDEPGRLRQLLLSLSRQQYPAMRAEILIIDDGSPQPVSADITAAALPFRATLLRLPRNQGRAAARNTGLAHAAGELVLFIDSDMTAAPELLSVHAEANGGDPCRVVIGDIRFAANVRRTALERYQDRRGVHRLAAGQPVPFKCFVTGNSSVPRILLQQVGGFDPGFRQYGGEDLELGYRLHRQGARFSHAPAARACHHHSRPLRHVCDLMYTYGRHSVPRLLQLHPELAPLLHLHHLEKHAGSLSRLLLLATRAPAYHALRAVCLALDRTWIPGPVLSYLIWASRTRGYLAARSAAEDR